MHHETAHTHPSLFILRWNRQFYSLRQDGGRCFCHQRADPYLPCHGVDQSLYRKKVDGHGNGAPLRLLRSSGYPYHDDPLQKVF